MVDNPEVTQVIEICPSGYRVKRGAGMWAEMYADDDELLDVELPWAVCGACKRRFLDWDNDGLCPECEHNEGSY